MANPQAGDKCTSAMQQCASGRGAADTNQNRHRPALTGRSGIPEAWVINREGAACWIIRS
jgi:hypothetical protein